MALVERSEVLIVGSGPAGASAAWPVVEAGKQVVMLEAGAKLSAADPPGETSSLAELRSGSRRYREAKAWPILLGEDLRVLESSNIASPKIRYRVGGERLARFSAESGIVAHDFAVMGVYARGGLSNFWGAGAGAFDRSDFADFPFGVEELAPSYESVARRIGISGSSEDDMAPLHGQEVSLQPPLELSPIFRSILDRYNARRESLRTRIGRSRLAVLSTDAGRRRACRLETMCSWGCPEKAIYNSADEVAELETRDNFTCLDNSRVVAIAPTDGGYEVTVANGSEASRKYAAPVVILAAGIFNSTRLVLSLLDCFDMDVRLLDSPQAAFALFVPTWLGKPLPSRALGMAQLSFALELLSAPGQKAAGSLYSAEHYLATEIISQLPLSYRGGRVLIRSMLSAMVIGLLSFPGYCSRSSLRLQRGTGGQDHRLVVNGGFSSEYDDLLRTTTKGLARDFRKLGIFILPGSIMPYGPGASARYAGSLAMGTWTSTEGEVMGATNLFVADASCLPALSGKSSTLTVMANADRIGRIVAGR